MMKSAIYIIEHDGVCNGIQCNTCPCKDNRRGYCIAVELAEVTKGTVKENALQYSKEWLIAYKKNDRWSKIIMGLKRIKTKKESYNMGKTNKEKAMKELEELKKEFDERTRKLEEIINQKESVAWQPQNGDTFYSIHTFSEIQHQVWDGDEYDRGAYNIGNCYKTEQEATDVRDARIILTRLQRLADEMNGEKLRNRDWQNREAYIIGMGWVKFVIVKAKNWGDIHNNTCFKSSDFAQKALNMVLKEFGEDKVKIALSGVWR